MQRRRAAVRTSTRRVPTKLTKASLVQRIRSLYTTKYRRAIDDLLDEHFHRSTDLILYELSQEYPQPGSLPEAYDDEVGLEKLIHVVLAQEMARRSSR